MLNKKGKVEYSINKNKEENLAKISHKAFLSHGRLYKLTFFLQCQTFSSD